MSRKVKKYSTFPKSQKLKIDINPDFKNKLPATSLSERGGVKVGKVDYQEVSRKDLILAMLAANQKYSDIQEALRVQLNQSIALNTISEYKSRYPNEIQKLRNEFIRNITNLVPIANIVHRALIRQRLVNDLLKPNKLWRTVPVWYQGQCVGHRLEGSHAVINEILDSQAKELNSVEDLKQRREMFELLKHSGQKALNFIIYGSQQEGD
jgi:hypothetical protein